MTIYNYRVPKHVATQGLLATDPLGTATQGFVEIDQVSITPDLTLGGSSLISFTYYIDINDTELVLNGSSLVTFVPGKKERGGRGGIPRKKRKLQPKTHTWSYKPVVLLKDRLEFEGSSVISFVTAPVQIPAPQFEFFKTLPPVIYREIELNEIQDFQHDLELFKEQQNKLQVYSLETQIHLPKFNSKSKTEFIDFSSILQEQDQAWLQMELFESSNNIPVIFLTQTENSLLTKIKQDDNKILELL